MTGSPGGPARHPAWTRLWQQGLRPLLIKLLVLYAVVGVIGAAASLFIASAPAFTTSSAGDGFGDFDEDVADSWNRFNAGVEEAVPSWTVEQAVAAIGDARGGSVVTMDGAGSVVDVDAVTAAVSGTDRLVLVTPPTPLGASETTRLRDNTLQQRWADQHGVSLVLVHGQQVWVPYGQRSKLIVATTPDAGTDLREAMRTGEITPTVLQVLQQLADHEARKGSARDSDEPETDTGGGTTDASDVGEPVDASTLALTDTRAPTARELAPVVTALDSGQLYTDPAVSSGTDFHAGWSALTDGGPLKVVLLPFAEPGTAIDWTTPLSQRYPGTGIVVLTGKWIESAGLDRELVVSAALQTYAVGGYALASAPPPQAEILDWVSSVGGISRAATAAHAELPAAAPGGIPSWLSYLVLGTSLVIAGAFGVQQWRRRRTDATRRLSRGDWRDAVLTTLTTCYLEISQAADLAFDEGVRQRARRSLDAGFAAIGALRGMPRDPQADDDRRQQAAAAQQAWTAIDEAAVGVGRDDLRPGTVSPALRPTPIEPRRPAQPFGGRPALTGRHRSAIRKAFVTVGVAFIGVVVGTVIVSRSVSSGAGSPVELRDSNVAGLQGDALAAVQRAIGDR
ncbi:MAG: hypothetical protein INR72_16385, partial [Williamsia herbipolensis]|nr:hypothetical protein [Williamsia herbipolensis]